MTSHKTTCEWETALRDAEKHPADTKPNRSKADSTTTCSAVYPSKTMTETVCQAKSSKISTNNNLVIYLYPLLHNQLICMAYIPACLYYSSYGWFSDTCVWGTHGNAMFQAIPMGKSPDPGQKCLPDTDDLAQLTLTALPLAVKSMDGAGLGWVFVEA